MALECKLGIVPDLTAIAADPDVARQLTADQVEALLAACSVCQAALVNRLLVLRASSNGQGQAQGSGDRLLSAKETADRLGVSLHYVYKHAHQFPFARHEGWRVLFSERGLERYLQGKTEKKSLDI